MLHSIREIRISIVHTKLHVSVEYLELIQIAMHHCHIDHARWDRKVNPIVQQCLFLCYMLHWFLAFKTPVKLHEMGFIKAGDS